MISGLPGSSRRSCLAAPAVASVRWDLVPDAPAGQYESLVTDGTDLAAIVSVYSGDTVTRWVAVRTSSGWQSQAVPNDFAPQAIALSATKLALVGTAVPFCVAASPSLWILDRASWSWSRIGDVPAATACETPVALAFESDVLLALTSSCRLLRWTGTLWETVPGWPTYGPQAACSAPFVRDGGRLFAVAGAIFEVTKGQVVYPIQPEGPERVGVAVLPEGLAFLQKGARGFADWLYVPGQPTPLSTPAFSTGPLLRWDGAFVLSTFAGPARLGEGRWTITRTAAPDTASGTFDRAWGPGGPFLDAGGELFAASSGGLFAARASVRRLLPVAVTGHGVSGAAYTTELALANFGETDTSATLELRDPAGASAGTTRISVALPARHTVRLDDLVGRFRLAAPGAPATGNVAIAFEGVSRDEDYWAGADVLSTISGLVTRTFVPAMAWGSGPGFYGESSVGSVPRVDSGVRTNVGWADAGDAGPAGPLSSPFSLVWTGDWSTFSIFAPAGSWTQAPLLAELPSVATGSVLKLSGPVYWGGPNCCWGWESVSPRDLIAYVVEVDQGTGDGSFAVLETPSLDADRTTLFLPTLVRSADASSSSELRLGRGEDDPEARSVELTFRGTIAGASRTVVWQEALAADSGIRFDAAAAVVTHAGLVDVGQVVDGTLSVKPDLTRTRSCFGSMRVLTNVPGVPGAVGATTSAIPAGRFASTRAIVPGLVDDTSLQSDLVLANPEPDGGPITHLVVGLVRGADGLTIGGADVTLAPGSRWQRDVRELVSDGGAAGGGYAVIRNAGAGRFVAYGVVHERSSGDGAERPMTGTE
jgi:hypothetical protein